MRVQQHFARALLAGLLAVACTANADPTYRVGAMVPNMGATTLNNHGDLVGETAFQARALLYSNGTLIDLGNLGGEPSAAYGINNTGSVVGVSRTDPASADRAFLYRDGSMRNLGTLGGTRSVANDINDAGQVVGVSNTADGNPQAFIYDGGVMRTFGAPANSVANAINKYGQIAGNTTIDEPGGGPGSDVSHPFLYRGGAVQDLSGVIGPDSAAEDLNDLGQVAGTIFGIARHANAFIYRDGVVTRVGTLGGDISVGRGINNLGQLVGWSDVGNGIIHGYLYAGGVLADLNALLDPSLGWEIGEASDINDLQQISAHGCRAGACFALRLDPIAAIPEPATNMMLAGGLGMLGLLGRWRRRASGSDATRLS